MKTLSNTEVSNIAGGDVGTELCTGIFKDGGAAAGGWYLGTALAEFGSIAGPVGTVAGAVIGGAAGYLIGTAVCS